MFRNSLFVNDPFFSGHMESMRQMESSMDAMMSNLMDPFGFFGGGVRQPAIGYDGYSRDYDRRGERQMSRQQLVHRQRQPAGMFDYFGGFGMMPNMHSLMQQQMHQAQNNPNSSYFSQSTVMTYQNTGDGQPRIYQASTSEGQANGVKEVRRSVKDSAQGVEKLSIAREMGDKSQVITKQRNQNTGAIEEDKELVNLDEEEEDEFNQQFQQRVTKLPYARHHHQGGASRMVTDRHATQQPQPLALEAPRQHHRDWDSNPQHTPADLPRTQRQEGRQPSKRSSPKKQKSVRF